MHKRVHSLVVTYLRQDQRLFYLQLLPCFVWLTSDLGTSLCVYIVLWCVCAVRVQCVALCVLTWKARDYNSDQSLARLTTGSFISILVHLKISVGYKL